MLDPVLAYKKLGISISKKGRYYNGLCPFHAEAEGSFVVYSDLSYYCFGCKKAGTYAKLAESIGIEFVPSLNYETIKLPQLFSSEKVKTDYFEKFSSLLKNKTTEEKKAFLCKFEKLRIEVAYLEALNKSEAVLIDYFFTKFNKLKKEAGDVEKGRNTEPR